MTALDCFLILTKTAWGPPLHPLPTARALRASVVRLSWGRYGPWYLAIRTLKIYAVTQTRLGKGGAYRPASNDKQL
jgi:hypothetical protein